MTLQEQLRYEALCQEQTAARQGEIQTGLFGNGLGTRFGCQRAAQQAPRYRPMTAQEIRTQQTQQGPGRKHVESRVVEPKLLT